MAIETPPLMPKQMVRYREDPVLFLQEQYVVRDIRSGKDRLVKLEPFQVKILRDVLCTRGADGLRQYNLALLGMGKKNGKSELASMVAVWHVYCDEREAEVYVVANDLEQSASVTFKRIARAIRKNPRLAREANVGKYEITIPATDSVIRAVSRDVPGSAGNTASLTVFDELWGFKDRLLYDEMTQNPVRAEPLTLVVTYAGYDRESLLHDLYEQGSTGDDPRFYFKWFTGDDANPASWVTEQYLAQQRRRLPPQVYRRLHRNEWSSPDAPFVEEWMVKRCTTGVESDDRRPGGEYVLTCDLGLTKDRAAAAVLHRDYRRGVVALDKLSVWEGSRERPVQIAHVASTLEAWHARYRPRAVVVDPWELRAFVQEHRNWRIVEFRFAGHAMYEMASILYSLICNAQLVLYPEAGRFTGRDGMPHDLQHELVNLVLVETPSGFRFDHRVGRHNDMSIAVGMGCWSLMRQCRRAVTWRELAYIQHVTGVKTNWEGAARREGEQTVVVDHGSGPVVVDVSGREVAAGQDGAGRIVAARGFGRIELK